MPLTGDAKEVRQSMSDSYSDKSKEEVDSIFYATANKEGRKPETWEKKGGAAVLRQLLSKRARPGGSN